MIKVSVTNLQNVITNIGYFESQELVDQWILENSSNRAFGESEEYTISQEDITAEIQASRGLYSKVELGKAARLTCESVLDLIAGYNIDRQLTSEQITIMQTTFGTIQSCLQASRPSTAKTLINLINPDGVLVTQEMKDQCLALLQGY